MLYFPFHIGDWVTGTKLMTTVEKGVYMDLLTYYYSVERPITEDECKRIARAYANAEQEAMQYVLQNNFKHECGAYRHEKCEEVIAQTKEKQTDISEKRRNAAKARWNKERKQAIDGENKKEMDADRVQLDMQMQCKCNADAMLTNNHKPITKSINNHNKQTTEIRYGGTTGPDPVCLENSLSENIRDAQDNSCDESKFEDDDSLLTVLEVIKLCSYNRLKVTRSQRLVDVVNSGAVSVGMVKECIDITKASNGSGAYFVGCLANAIHEPDRYMTTIQKIRRSAQKEKEAEQFLLEHGDEVF